MNSPLLSPVGRDHPRTERVRERAHLEQAVAVVPPVDLVEQPVLDGLVVAPRRRIDVTGRAEVPAQRHHDRHRSRARPRLQRRASKPGLASRAPSMKSPTKSLAAPPQDPEVRGTRPGAGGADRARASADVREAVEQCRRQRLGRAVVDDDHLVVVARDAALVRRHERRQRCGNSRAMSYATTTTLSFTSCHHEPAGRPHRSASHSR